MTDLRGSTHSSFFVECLRVSSMAPAHVSVDGAPAWNGVKLQVEAIHGDSDAVSVLNIEEKVRNRGRKGRGGGSLLCLKMCLFQVIGVRRFNKTSSIYNTPVERHWHDVNLVTYKYKEEFRLLETLGVFEKHDPIDLFCLTSVYFDCIKADLDAHYNAMRFRNKKKDTRNPDYPVGTRRRCSLYSHGNDCGTPLTDSEISAVAEVGTAHFRSMEAMSTWQQDPLDLDVQRDMRSRLVEEISPASLSEKYIAFRTITK